MADIIILNVGGHLYTTTKSTIGKYPDSMLGIMMNGKFDMNRDSNGHPFIDRDGEMFKYILNFLRSTHLALPTNFKQLELLSVEADFYQIEPLKDIINQMKVKKRVNHLEIIQMVYSENIEKAYGYKTETRLSGNKEVLLSLPADIIGAESLERLQNKNVLDVTEFGLVGAGSNTRLRLGKELHSRGWKLLSSVVVTFSSDSYYKLIERWSLEPSISSEL